MNETQELSYEQIQVQQSYQSNQDSYIPEKFQLPFVRKSQNESIFNRFIEKRKQTMYYKRLLELQQESEILSLNKLQQQLEQLIEKYLEMGYEDNDQIQIIEKKIDRKSNQKKMQNFLRLSENKKIQSNNTPESELSISQNNKKFEEDPEIEKSFFNRQDNLSQFQSLKFLQSRNYGFAEDDIFSKTDQNYRSKFNEQVNQDLDKKKFYMQSNNVSQNMENFQSNDRESLNEQKNKKFDQIISQINNHKIKLNPVNFAFREQNSVSDNQFNSDITNKPKNIVIQVPDKEQSNDDSNNQDGEIDNDLIQDEQTSDQQQDSEDTFDKNFKIKIDINKKDLKKQGLTSYEIKEVMDSLTLKNDMQLLKQNMKKLNEEEALLAKEMKEQDKIIQEYKKYNDKIQQPFSDDNDSLINEEGKSKNKIDSSMEQDSQSDQLYENSQLEIKQQQEDNLNKDDQQMIQIDIYDSHKNITQLQIPKQRFSDNLNSSDHIVIPADILKRSLKKNHIWDKSSSEYKDDQNNDNDDIQIREKNFSIKPIKKQINDKDTFTNSSASRYQRITQSQGKKKLIQKSQEQQENDLKISLDPKQLKSLKKFKSEIQNNIKESNEIKDNPKRYSNIYKNSNEDLDQLRKISQKFNEVKAHELEQTQQNQKIQQPQMFSFKQKIIEQKNPQQCKKIHQSDVLNKSKNMIKKQQTQTKKYIQKENAQNIKMHLTLIKNKLKSKQPSKKQFKNSLKRNKTQIKKKNSINKNRNSQNNNKFLSKKYNEKDITCLNQEIKSNQDQSQYSINKSKNSQQDKNSIEIENDLLEQNNQQKDNKQFDYLKRKKKTYSIHKVKWKAKSKVNCWNNPKQKSPKKIKMNYDIDFDKVKAKVESIPKQNKKSPKQSTISYNNILNTYENEFVPKYTEVYKNQVYELNDTILPKIKLDHFQFNGDFYQIILNDKKKYKKLLSFLDDQYDYILNNQSYFFIIYFKVYFQKYDMIPTFIQIKFLPCYVKIILKF